MSLHHLLNNYFPEDINEINYKQRILDFLSTHQNPFARSLKIGHFTASAFLLNTDKTKFLLMHHKKINLWLQPGGHCDGNPDVLAVAIKEAQEESGIMEIIPISTKIFDIDIHTFPGSEKDPEHYHYDVRFLLKTVGNDHFIQNEESHALRWVDLYSSSELSLEHSIKRMVHKYNNQ
ncbi:MAG: NUDIX hydrolase [Alphaproteobacteria bacterium]|nr:NUDIX hydrolase [Alphaproteobacteria bacterium]